MIKSYVSVEEAKKDLEKEFLNKETGVYELFEYTGHEMQEYNEKELLDDTDISFAIEIGDDEKGWLDYYAYFYFDIINYNNGSYADIKINKIEID